MTIATDKWNLPKPEANENHTRANFNALLDAIDAAVFSVTPMTEVQRDALAGADLWTGRVVYNTDSALGEVYDGAAWGPVADFAGHLAAADPHAQYLTGAEGTAAIAAQTLAGHADTDPTGLADGFIWVYDATAGGWVVEAKPSARTIVVADGVAAEDVIAWRRTGDTQDRLVLEEGRIEFGSGAAARDVNLYRGGANAWNTDDSFSAEGEMGHRLYVTQGVQLGDDGNKGYIKFGYGSQHIAQCAGSPEGSVNSYPGALCMDVTNGRLFVKRSGAGTLTGWHQLPGSMGFRAWRGSSTSVLTSTVVSLQPTSETWDGSGCYTAATGKLVSPSGIAGVWAFWASVQWPSNATGKRMLRFKNTLSGDYAEDVRLASTTGSSGVQYNQISGLVYLSSLAEATLEVWQDSGSSLGILSGTSFDDAPVKFAAMYLGGA